MFASSIENSLFVNTSFVKTPLKYFQNSTIQMFCSKILLVQQEKSLHHKTLSLAKRKMNYFRWRKIEIPYISHLCISHILTHSPVRLLEAAGMIFSVSYYFWLDRNSGPVLHPQLSVTEYLSSRVMM